MRAAYECAILYPVRKPRISVLLYFRDFRNVRISVFPYFRPSDPPRISVFPYFRGFYGPAMGTHLLSSRSKFSSPAAGINTMYSPWPNSLITSGITTDCFPCTCHASPHRAAEMHLAPSHCILGGPAGRTHLRTPVPLKGLPPPMGLASPLAAALPIARRPPVRSESPSLPLYCAVVSSRAGVPRSCLSSRCPLLPHF